MMARAFYQRKTNGADETYRLAVGRYYMIINQSSVTNGMARLFVKYLAVYNNENLRKTYRIVMR